MRARLLKLLLVPAGIALAIMASGCNKPPPDAAGVAATGTTPAVANVADADVTTNVTTALVREASLKGADIRVVTLKGEAQLIGVLDSQAQVDTALKIARDADGVHTVHNELTVKK
jgi:hyperosmotically inducible periplasmic protein